MWFLNKETKQKFFITDKEHIKTIRKLEHFEEVKVEKKSEPKEEKQPEKAKKKPGRPPKKEAK